MVLLEQIMRKSPNPPTEVKPGMEWATDAIFPPDEKELARRREGAQRFAQLFSFNPYYKARAEKDPDYWAKLYAGNIKL